MIDERLRTGLSIAGLSAIAIITMYVTGFIIFPASAGCPYAQLKNGSIAPLYRFDFPYPTYFVPLPANTAAIIC